MGNYGFRAGFHGDLILSTSSEEFNFGYNDIESQPLYSWLIHAQFTGEELFKDFETLDSNNVEFRSDMDGGLSKGIQRGIELRKRMPLPLEMLQDEEAIWRISRFTAGNNKTTYDWRISEQGVQLWVDPRRGSEGERKIFDLDPAEHREYALAHARYVTNAFEDFKACCLRYRKVINILNGFEQITS